MSYDWMTAHRARYEVPVVIVDDDEEDEEAEPASVLVSSAEVDLDPEKLPASPKKTVKTVLALGWEILGAQEALVHYAPVLMLGDGKKGLRGDVRTPECDKNFLHISVIDPTHHIGFTATWINGKFDNAIGRDPVGFLRELYFDYKPKNYVVNALGKALALQRAGSYDLDYNDGTSYVTKTHKMKSTEFTAWLGDWLSLATEQKEDAA